MRRTRMLATTVAVLSAGVALAAPAPASAARTLKLGALTLHPCGDVKGWWCGSLPRALDPGKPRGPHIGIGFRWRPAEGKASGPALVAVEGGPGYPSIGSRVEYTGIYGPLLKQRGLLLVDNRGTGTSDLVDCGGVQKFGGATSGPVFNGRVADCARQLVKRHPGVHAADLYATAYAVNDLAAVVRKLELGKVDFYGDSYGTFFGQSFMARHPDLLHSVVLDSAYPVRDLDPWYASSGTVARSAMDAVCARDAGCAAAAPGSATARLEQLLVKLREAAITGRTRDADASSVRARAGLREVVDMVQDAASDPVVYRELDASVRAALAGDNVPLLRLVAQSRTWSHSPGGDPGYFSNGLYWAVACMDYPQLFSMKSTPAARREQFAASVAAGPPAGAFDPFTTNEWLLMSAYSQPYQGCLQWPSPAHAAPVVPATLTPLPASVPVLIVGGDVDSLTPLSDAQAFGPKLGASVRVINLTNTVHVTSEGDTFLVEGANCGRRIIRAFVRAPDRLASIDAGCAAEIPPIHTPGAYPVRLAEAAPATLTAGSDPGDAARRAATVAAGALADATIRRWYSGVKRGPGLRGGTFTTAGDGPIRFRLSRVRLVSDATVDGSGSWRFSDGAVSGNLVVKPARGPAVRVQLSWTQRSRLAEARVGASTLSLPAP